MKATLTSFLIFFTTILAGQTDSLGIDNADTLNRQELKYFDFFNSSGMTFDFKHERIIFILRKPEPKIVSKKEFFDVCIKPSIKNNSVPCMSTRSLLEDEKKKSGYDEIFISPSGGLTYKQRKKILNELHSLKRVKKN